MPTVADTLVPLNISFWTLEIPGATALFQSVTLPQKDLSYNERGNIKGQGGEVLFARETGVPVLSPLTCTGGMSADKTLETWYDQIVAAKDLKTVGKDVTLNVFDTSNAPVGTWMMTGVVLTMLNAPSVLMAGGGDFVSFDVQFSVEDIQRKK